MKRTFMILCAPLQRGLLGELSQFYNDSQILLNLTIQHRAIAPLIYASVLTSIRALQFSAAMAQVNFINATSSLIATMQRNFCTIAVLVPFNYR